MPFEPLEKADLVIGETTYSDKVRPIANSEMRKKDLEKLKSVIDYEVIENKRRVLIPVFALDRLPEVLTEIYKLYHNDTRFVAPVLIDTPLGIKHLNTYLNILSDDKLNLLKEVLKWKNIIQVNSFTESKE